MGTITEVYDYMRVLWARAGVQHCHLCGREVAALTSQQLVDEIRQLPKRARALLLAPLVVRRKGEHRDVIERARERGFVRMRIDEDVRRLDENLPPLAKKQKHEPTIGLIIYREAGREEVIYALDGLEKKIFIAKYKVKLPSEAKIKKAIRKF